MLRTVDEIVVYAPLERVFALAADVERWPALLPHYRYVRRLGATLPDGSAAYAMGARRSGFPIRWSAVQRREREAQRIAYRGLRVSLGAWTWSGASSPERRWCS